MNTTAKKKTLEDRKLGKKRAAAFKRVDRLARYSIGDAMKLVKGCKTSKFDESVDIAINLSVDPRHADQMVRGAVVMPHGTGKTIRLAVFAKGQKAKEAQDAGADIVGGDDLHDRIAGGFMDFDQVIATPDMMGVVGKLGRVLGPRGLMPNPKVGTVTMDVTKAIREAKAGKVEYKVEKSGIVHCGIGKTSMESEHLAENFKALFENILKQKPSTAKGVYVKAITVSSTMGPGVKLDIAAATTSSSAAED
jgi:large subunit ribosomal protein L1